MSMIKKIVAREWLIFLMTIVPSGILVIYLHLKQQFTSDHLFSVVNDDILLLFFPYVLVQFIRTVIWAFINRK